MTTRVVLLLLSVLVGGSSLAHAAVTAFSRALDEGQPIQTHFQGDECTLATPVGDPCDGMNGCLDPRGCFPQPLKEGPGARSQPFPNVGGAQVGFSFVELENPYDANDVFCFELAHGQAVEAATLQLRCRLPERHHPDNGRVTVVVDGLEDDGRLYCWRVRNVSSIGWADAPTAMKCFRNGPPAPPTLQDPEGVYGGHGPNVTFSWTTNQVTSEAVDRWEIDVSPNVGSCDSPDVSPGYTCGPFPNVGETYSWTLAACNDAGCRSSGPRSFVNGEVPGEPTTPSLTDEPGSTLFDWARGPSGGYPTEYRFWLTPEGGAPPSAHGCPKSDAEAAASPVAAQGGTSAGGISCAFTGGDGETYRWHVRACNLRGCGAARSGTYTKTADDVLPPVNLSENDFGDGASFSWAPNPSGTQPTGYELWVLPGVGHDCPAAPGMRIGTTGLSCNFESGGGYVWYVAACDADGCSAPSTRTFEKSLVLAEDPQGLDTSGAGCGDVTILWNPPPSGPAPTGYRVSVAGLDGGFVPPSCVGAQTAGTSFTCAGLERGRTYQATVQSCRPDGCRTPGVGTSFGTDAPEPGAPALQWPGQNEMAFGYDPEHFQWTTALHAVRYRLVVMPGNGTAEACLVQPETTTFTSCPNLAADGTWYGVQVFARNACGDETPSAAHFMRSLPLVQTPDTLELVDAGREMTFRWSPALFEGPATVTIAYHLDVQRRATGADPFVPLAGFPRRIDALPGTTPSITLGASDGIQYERWTYRWRVTAFATGGNPSSPVQEGQASSPPSAWKFHEAGPRTAPGAPRPLEPRRGIIEPGTSIVLEWEPGAHAEWHEVYVWEPGGPPLVSCNGRFSDAIGLDGPQATLCTGFSNDGSLQYWKVTACNDYDNDEVSDCTDSRIWFVVNGLAEEPGELCPMP